MNYIRHAADFLKDWKSLRHRKPLVLRGARQVGKSSLVRSFGKQHFQQFIEINFEKSPEYKTIFQATDPKVIVRNLEVHFNQKIDLENCLLFLDEIQLAPEAFQALRYFYEDLPALAVVAAGSLLDLYLNSKLAISVPVGRIEYLFLGPLQWDEYLRATDNILLLDKIKNFQFDRASFTPTEHQKLLHLVHQFWLVGGMPAAIRESMGDHHLLGAQREHESIFLTYLDDFRKYSKRIDPELIQRLLIKTATMIGKKIKYSEYLEQKTALQIREGLKWLHEAQIIHMIQHSGANQPPLSALANEKYFKALYLDVGLLCSALKIKQITPGFSSNGMLAEQFVGQHLWHMGHLYQKPSLYFWHREKKNAAAEVDFLIECQSNVIPIEVKAGTSTKAKSLNLYIAEKLPKQAIQIGIKPYMQSKTGKTTVYDLPFYLITELNRLIK